jgi:2-polyprenyl-3-methyl-5-hydroxy-6-metoxy-1,4-benzoquinol methylase
MTTTTDVRRNFDESYYRRFYLDPATRVHDANGQRRLAAFVFSYLDYLDIDVWRVLDLGCGLGHWRAQLAQRHPRASYTGVDASDYLCQTYGWEKGTAAGYRGRGQYDLVLCQGVLQYVDDDEVRASLANIARLCRGALFLEIPTQHDWDENCDRTVTDGDVHLRTGAWYRDAIGEHFRSIGGGLFLPKDSPVVLYELEGSSA